MLDPNLQVPGAPDTDKTPLPGTDLRVVQRISRLLDTMMEAEDNDEVRRFESEICRLPCKNYGTLEFDMSQQRLDLFLQAARSAMTQHLNGLARPTTA
jgi:NTE family protein